MIGSGLKKLANEYGMKIDAGVGYGNMAGFAATMSDGANIKTITFSTYFTDPAHKGLFMDKVGQVNVQKEFGIQSMQMSERVIQVVFADTIGTMKRIRAFLAWFLPLLREHNATTSNVCPECGADVASGQWVLVDGVAHHMHDACAQKVINAVQEDNTRRNEEAAGSYVMGLIGALLGAAVGAIVWAFVLSMGYVASIVGLAMGWLADKGYGILKGKQGKLKVWILIVAVIAGVVLGTYGGAAIGVVQGLNEMGYTDYTVSEIIEWVGYLKAVDTEFNDSINSSIGVGLLFAALGVWGLLRKTSQEVSDRKTVVLK